MLKAMRKPKCQRHKMAYANLKKPNHPYPSLSDIAFI